MGEPRTRVTGGSTAQRWSLPLFGPLTPNPSPPRRGRGEFGPPATTKALRGSRLLPLALGRRPRGGAGHGPRLVQAGFELGSRRRGGMDAVGGDVGLGEPD